MKVKLKYEVESPYDYGLINARGIDDVTAFMCPSKDFLQDPFDLDNMQEAIDLVDEYAGSKTLLILDSDMDGYCSSTILYSYIKGVYPDWEIDIATHEAKGHGLGDILPYYDISDYDLILIPDAGSNDDEFFLEFPNKKFLVLDHHLRDIEGEIPSNATVVNNQLSEKYENKCLSGAGVTWQFCRAYDAARGREEAEQYIDLAATSIISDIMDTTHPENRYIIETGLNNINNHFLKVLINNASYSLGGNKITPTGISFYIAPTVNAMCRMGTREEKQRMFQAFIDPFAQVESNKRGAEKGSLVDVAVEALREGHNAKGRQRSRQEKMIALCDQRIIENDLLQNKLLTIVLDSAFDGIPTELNGVTASRIAEKTQHPIMIGRVNEEGDYKGSIRGLETIDMPPFKEFLLSSGLFNYVQGHNNAAGFSLPYKNLDRLHLWANEELKDIDLNSKTWYVDFEFKGANYELQDCISDLENLQSVWGHGFPTALISVKNLGVNRPQIQVLGSKSDTVKIISNGVAFLFFRRSMKEVQELTEHNRSLFNIVGTPNMNEFRGRYTPQITVKDYTIQPSDF